MEITPASLPQIQKGRRGRVVFVDNDAFDIAKRLKEIDRSLRLAWNEFGEYFVVYQVFDDGTEHLVTVWDPEKNGAPDGRLVERIQKIARPNYDIEAEIARLEAEAEKQSDYEFSEKIGPYAELLYHAVRKDMGVKDSIIVPDSFPRRKNGS